MGRMSSAFMSSRLARTKRRTSSDGKERQVATGRETVWLHPECERFHLKAETLP
jgi:hypothetical protein